MAGQRAQNQIFIPINERNISLDWSGTTIPDLKTKRYSFSDFFGLRWGHHQGAVWEGVPKFPAIFPRREPGSVFGASVN